MQIVALLVLLALCCSVVASERKMPSSKRKSMVDLASSNDDGVPTDLDSPVLTTEPLGVSEVVEKEKINSQDVNSDERVCNLRGKGREYLSRKDYNNAARCYAAVLQIIEGIGGVESGVLRRRCCLTLAECEIKVGQLERAVSLCSEVIEEVSTKLSSSSFSNSNNVNNINANVNRDEIEATADKEKEKEEDMRQAMGKAHFRRGVSLSRLGHHKVALLDLQSAHAQLPEDENILSRIVTIQKTVDEETEAELELEKEEKTEEETAESVEEALLNDESEEEDEEVKLMNKLLDIVDECHLYESRRVSLRQLDELIRMDINEEAALMQTQTMQNSASIGSSIGDMGGLGGGGGLSDLLGGLGGTGGGDLMSALGGGGGAGGLMSALGGGGGGLGALTSMMGGLGGGEKGGGLGLESLTGMLPAIGAMAGLDPKLISQGKEILGALVDVFKVFRNVYRRVVENKEKIAIGFMLGWLVLSAADFGVDKFVG